MDIAVNWDLVFDFAAGAVVIIGVILVLGLIDIALEVIHKKLKWMADQ